jgi:hypothetical protein
MHYAHFQVGMLLDEESTAAIQCLVLVQCAEAKHLDTLPVRIEDTVLDVGVDARPL